MVEELNDSILAKIGTCNRMDLCTSWMDKSRRRMEDGSCSCYRSDRKRERSSYIWYALSDSQKLQKTVLRSGVTWQQAMTPIAAYGFLVFNLLCAPCFAAMGAIKREMNNTKWFLFAIGYQCGLAYLVSLCIYQIGTLVTGGGFGIWTVVAFAIIIGFLYLLFRPYKESSSLNVNVKGMAKAR